jgi:hypothetical protein
MTRSPTSFVLAAYQSQPDALNPNQAMTLRVEIGLLIPRTPSPTAMTHLSSAQRGLQSAGYRENPKAPKIDVLARHYLWRGLSKLPDVSKHVADVAAVEKMDADLEKALRDSGIDPARAEAIRNLLR